jgi:hypothetical protein
MLRGEQKVLYCTQGVIVEPGRKMDSEGVDTLEDRSKETGESGMATGVVIVESTAVDKDEREIATEDDRAMLGGKG